MTCLSAACFAALFYIAPVMAFSAHHLENGSITYEMHSGEASMYAELLEGCDILVCPSVPFGTCSWSSQLYTAIIAVWNFVLTLSQYIVISGSTECLPEFDFKGTTMPFGVTFLYHSQKSTSSRFNMLSGSCLTAGERAASFFESKGAMGIVNL